MFSVARIVLLISILISVPYSAVAQERSRYRVEVLVFSLLEPQAPPRAQAELREFTDAVDLADRPRRLALKAQNRDFLFSLGNPALLPAPPLRRTAEPRGPWDDVDLIEVRSERMADVWRNLRLSESYRPELLLSWEQAGEAPFPAVRAHNDATIRVDQPWAAWRVMPPPAGENESPRPQLAFQYSMDDGQLRLAPLPDPHTLYALEGTVRLRRSRFLHVDLDLELRERGLALRRGIPGPPLLAEHHGYAVHALTQSRQVRTERMEYFDSPAIGALVWVTEIEVAGEDQNEDTAR